MALSDYLETCPNCSESEKLCYDQNNGILICGECGTEFQPENIELDEYELDEDDCNSDKVDLSLDESYYPNCEEFVE